MNLSIFDTIKILIEKGMTVEDAIKEWESITYCQVPEHIKDMITEEL